MLRIEGKHTEIRAEAGPEHPADGEGLLFLAVLVASWLVAIGVGWIIWRLVPL